MNLRCSFGTVFVTINSFLEQIRLLDHLFTSSFVFLFTKISTPCGWSDVFRLQTIEIIRPSNFTNENAHSIQLKDNAVNLHNIAFLDLKRSMFLSLS